MINGHQGAFPLTEDEATLQLKEAWASENTNKFGPSKRSWTSRRKNRKRCNKSCMTKGLKQRKEAEKKKPKLNPFDPNHTLGKYIEPRPVQYALNKINNLEYIELDYFTLRGCKDTSADANKSISQDTLTFTQVDGFFAICPLAAIKPSRNIRCDEDLSWEEMFGAKNTMLHFMGNLLHSSGTAPQKK
ncbi:hypothetical protein EDB86DRAFT_2824910 [Lactarius hatsudake]|nr:hypothetical protein EDB86DRAFT_2824910 [Lactarius hatsudake]